MVYIETMRTVVLFTRSPEAEARAKGLPRKAGARLFRALLDSWCRSARTAGVRVALMAPAGQVAALAARYAAEGVRVEAQRGDTFAARLEDALDRAFRAGAAPVLLAGGDSPAPRPAALAQVLDQLAAAPDRVVLGPSPDGGVNCIGLSCPAPELLAGVPWTSAAVDAALRARAAALGLDVRVLPEVLDVDRHADVARAHALAGSTLAWRALRHALAAYLGLLPAAAPLPPPPRPLRAALLRARDPPAGASCR